MGRIVDILVRDLQGLLGEVGRDGGRISASVYDTAMVARLAPPAEGPEPALEWLLSQQRSDGGWGLPRYPIGRDLPTLAAVLALRELRKDAMSREACESGLAFLRRQAGQWTVIPDDLPLSLELTLPAVLREATRAGLEMSGEPYRLLSSEGERKRRIIDRFPLVKGAAATYAWEALGAEPSAELLDRIGSVGTSPSATAAWLSASADRAQLQGARQSAIDYLRLASSATGVGVPGVSPVVFPVERFEQSWSALSVVSSGLSSHAAIVPALRSALDDLAAAARPEGWSFSDTFVPDGDDTACAVAVLKSAGYGITSRQVRGFEGDTCFFVYPGERNPSLSVNAHALYALSFFGEDSIRARQFLVSRQESDGRFADKFHASWLYTTHRAILALDPDENAKALQSARGALLSRQRLDGGFGEAQGEDSSETSYGLLSLRALRDKGVGGGEVDAAIERAYRFLLLRYRPFASTAQPLWIGKELYAMPRVDRAVELCALLSAAIEVGE